MIYVISLAGYDNGRFPTTVLLTDIRTIWGNVDSKITAVRTAARILTGAALPIPGAVGKLAVDLAYRKKNTKLLLEAADPSLQLQRVMAPLSSFTNLGKATYLNHSDVRKARIHGDKEGVVLTLEPRRGGKWVNLFVPRVTEDAMRGALMETPLASLLK
ncbi:hypothetical protein HS1genome_1707 [Sulfodiicoccus acidiphilus]|uniref:Uncharacterized protein n=1 Tax=Sulfodiicoccus acidiphilus TaxID=1670455 RepID=A0A348B566_9CREN|nr:hypothetical protein [Sulfodiicoccus acidiphilus]BBD73318.1 hypothetical protein HS1genome_1707 [Sulfodiicoccus acidiphilus]GGT89145.1 hypothetical protein GCM10007116_03720 [Sulfodiicoccus acidiphilus]